MGRYLNAWTVVGAVLVAAGSAPLLAVGVMAKLGLWPDPNPNPIGFGLLFLVTFVPGVVCVAVGVAASRAEPSPEPPAPVAPHPELTAEQRAYVSSASFAGTLGIFYFLWMGVPGTFFRHILDNIAWTRMVANARRWAWETGNWPDFETFRRRSRQADRAAQLTLALLVPVLLLLLFGAK